MNGLGDARKYADPWGGVDEEIAPERVRQWGRDVATRKISVGMPGLYFTPGVDEQGRRRIFKTEEPPEGAAAVDIGFGAITEAKALSQSRKLVRAYGKGMTKRGWPKLAALEQEAIAALDMSDLFRRLPSKVWERVERLLPVKKIPSHPTATGLKSSGSGPFTSKIWLSRESREPVKTLGHEIAHHIDTILGSSKGRGPLNKLHSSWGAMADDMASMELFWKNRDPALSSILYQHNPRERFANRFADAIVNEGLDFREALKMSVHEVRANLGQLRSVLHESIDDANRFLSKTGDPNEIMKYNYW